MHFETIDAALMESAGVELFTSAYLQQDIPDQAGMRKSFRDRYAAEPDENALLGADAIDILLNGWKNQERIFRTNYHSRTTLDVIVIIGSARLKPAPAWRT